MPAPACLYFSFFKRVSIFLSWLQTDSYKKTGCYNLLCPGLVQVDNRIALGACLSRISVYGGNQYELNFNVWKVEQYFYLITVQIPQICGYTCIIISYVIFVSQEKIHSTNDIDVFEILLVLVQIVYV